MHGTPHVVGDPMTRMVTAVDRRTTFKEIVRMMQDWKVSALPVLEGEGRVVGLVSEADLLPKEEFRGSDPDRHTQLRRLSDLAKAGAVTAEELMTAPALTTRPEATLAEEVRREVVSYLFPPPESAVRVQVRDGVVKLTGRVRDTSLVPVAARLVRAVEGVVDGYPRSLRACRSLRHRRASVPEEGRSRPGPGAGPGHGSVTAWAAGVRLEAQ
ncbi:CBS domain-containing protein [Streptomyces fructofermentans]|uniref:CBS domain-containing protein n=1 Tax=Streptomyces fructofermentans TaxID=152141 RepID=UPI003795BAE4